MRKKKEKKKGNEHGTNHGFFWQMFTTWQPKKTAGKSNKGIFEI
jgi:hypothetical protein